MNFKWFTVYIVYAYELYKCNPHPDNDSKAAANAIPTIAAKAKANDSHTTHNFGRLSRLRHIQRANMGNICGGSQTSATGGAPLVRSGSCLAPSYIVSKSSGILPAPSDIQHVFGPNHTLLPLSEPHNLRVFF